MRRNWIVASIACTAVLAIGAQERMKPKEPADFKALLGGVQTDWDAGKYGSVVRKLGELTKLAAQKRSEAVRAALPDAPPDYVKEQPRPENDVASNPMLAAMAPMAANMIEQRYVPRNRGSAISVTVNADSPLVGMLGMMFGNPAALGQDGEVVGYGAHRALFKREGSSLSLQIVLSDRHLVNVEFPGQDEETLFAMFDQRAVDRIAAALEN